MQRLFSFCLGRVRRPPPSDGDAGPCAAETSEVREKPRGGLHGAAAGGDLARLQRHWWRKRFRINGRDAEKQTPLHLACANGQADVVRFLARKKCQLNPRDSFKKSPLMKAVEHQHKDCVAILLEHGANPNLRDASGHTALHLAAITASKPLVELLLEHNADIEAQNKLGYTPLTVAIAERSEELVEFLLQKGADVHAQDKNKRTTLMVAALAGDMNIIKILLQYGADLSQEDLSGCTVLHYARASRHAVIEKQLEQYMGCEMRGECSAGGTEGPAVLDSSCSGKNADSPLGTPTLTGAGVFPAAGAQEQDDDSPFDSESDCEAPAKASADELPPAADGKGACAQPVAEESGNGVFPAAGAQEQDDDSPFDSESDCEAPTKASAGVCLPPVYKREAWVQCVAEESGNGVFPAAGAQVSAPEREELQLKKDASCQTDFQGVRQTWVKQPWQELANPLKRSSLTEASPEAVNSYSVYLQEQKLQLQKKLYHSKAKLQELRERHIRTERYAEYLRNALKWKEMELTFRNLQVLLVTYFGTAAIPELEDRIQRLQGQQARLEATVQQQAKTIEALRKKLQACASSHNGLEDLVTGFQTTRTAKEHQCRQRGSESKEVKKLGKTKCRSEALLDEVWKRKAALEEEQTRLKMLLQMSSTTPTASAARRRKSQLSFRGDDERDEESCSELTN
ncbi:putative ankyrin repeat domain-containing protein 20A4 isoform X2 [Aquila chrysaetos chrysaetos]|uniref:putative ankyrin repeat domain-containing protein 20A4 isoform X2 n=1 Tax=Aquila chrysaetos chrysaetos TaxID=223781 RepID=UPI001B7D3D3E|nr:putative ankyrin repeat domain-containing protein 20A4 isoform X2 [Aquila chrysaetos chrysaetos]